MPTEIRERKMTDDKDKRQTPAAAMREVNKALRDNPSGQAIEGILGEDDRKPDILPTPETDPEERHKYINFLKEVIIPPKVTSKSSDEEDRRSLALKLDLSDISVLRRLVPEKFRNRESKELTPAEKAEMGIIYKNVSP